MWQIWNHEITYYDAREEGRNTMELKEIDTRESLWFI